MKLNTATISAFVFISSLSQAQAMDETARSVKQVKTPIHNDAGQKLYVITLNAFRIREVALADQTSLLKKAKIAGIDEAPHQPAGWAVATSLAKKYRFNPVEVYTWSSPSVVAWLTDYQAKNIAADPLVTGVSEDEEVQVSPSQSTYGDLITGNEVTSWAKVYTNTADSISSTLPIYLMDSSLGNTKTNQPDLNIIYNSGYAPQYQEHVVHVAGVIGAKVNGFGAVGINPNQPLKLFALLAATNAGVREIADAAMRDAEVSDIFSAINMSQNGALNSWEHDADTPGGRKLRALSNRMLVTQSAGNKEADACSATFHYRGSQETPHARDNDGIMVVGGLMRDGTRFTGGNELDPGSNTGACVEVWAPAKEITSTAVSNFADPNNPAAMAPNGTVVNSGTSFSAPMVAAIATRYGDASTRPLEREAYIRAGMQHTGSWDGGRPIRTVRYTPPSAHNLPKRLNIVGATSPTGSGNLHVLYDGKFYDDVNFWVAGGNYGSITLDLGSIKTVTGIRVTPRTDVNTNLKERAMDFAVGGSNDPDNIAETAYFTENYQADQAPVYIPLSTTSRYIRVNASNQHSWVAYSEIEVYGY